MSILQSFERAAGGLLEGVFGRLFRSEVRPMELAHKLTREMDEHRTASVSRVYAPNEYLVWLSPQDRAHYEGVEDELMDELCAYLLEHARREELTLASRPVVAFHTDERLTLGEFGIQARLVRPEDDGAGRDEGGEWGAEEPQADETMLRGAAGRVHPQETEPAAQPRARAFLRLAGRRLLVAPAGAVIGRSRSCDVVVEDPGVSRRHAEIRPAGEGWSLHDLGSTNGVYVNAAQIHGPTPLRSGDRIELGQTEITFEAQ